MYPRRKSREARQACGHDWRVEHIFAGVMRKEAPNRKLSMAFSAVKNVSAGGVAEGRMVSEGTKLWLPLRLPGPGTLDGIRFARRLSRGGLGWSKQYNLGEEA